MIRIVSRHAQNGLSDVARDSPKKRAHMELHSGYADRQQSLIVAMVPGTYVRPHRFPKRAQTFAVLSGMFLLKSWDVDTSERGPMLLQPGAVVHIDEGSGYHSWVCLVDGTLLEVLPGPHVEGDRENMPGQLPEDAAAVGELVQAWTKQGWALVV